jgi:hypothetical protein
VIVDLLAKSIRQASEAAHSHPRRQVLAFDIRRADVLRVRITADGFHFASDANSGRIARFVFKRRTINFMQLCVVNVRPKRAFNRFQIRFVTVCRDLYTVLDAIGTILHEVFRPIRAASTANRWLVSTFFTYSTGYTNT